MKFAEMKLLLVFREWVLLKDYENLDAELTSKLNAKIHEKKDIDLRVWNRERLLLIRLTANPFLPSIDSSKNARTNWTYVATRSNL